MDIVELPLARLAVVPGRAAAIADIAPRMALPEVLILTVLGRLPVQISPAMAPGRSLEAVHFREAANSSLSDNVGCFLVAARILNRRVGSLALIIGTS